MFREEVANSTLQRICDAVAHQRQGATCLPRKAIHERTVENEIAIRCKFMGRDLTDVRSEFSVKGSYKIKWNA